MKKGILIGFGIVLLAVIVIAAVLLSNPNSGSTDSSGSSSNVSTTGGSESAPNVSEKVITIDAQRFEYTPSVLTVNKGDHVKIVVNNQDTMHGIMIPEFGVSGVDSVEFVANKTGTFQFRCPTMCGEGHRNMVGTLIVK